MSIRPMVVALLASLAGPSLLAAQSVDSLLQDAERRAWLTDWSSATPLYAEAERLARASGDARTVLFAKFGRLRGQMQTLQLQRISEEIAADLARPSTAEDKRLRLRGFAARGDIDLEWDVREAERDWLQVRALATELEDAGWQNRADGELGMIAFLKGDTGAATKAVQVAYDTATKLGDIGGQLRYLSSIANGILLAGYAPIALGFVDRALKLAQEHPETGVPFVALSTKVLVLLEMKQLDEAERFAREAMGQAQSGDRRIKEIELNMMLARIAERRGQPERRLEHLERSRASAQEGGVLRLLADVEAGLADVFRQQGKLARARAHAEAAVDLTATNGGRFLLPLRLGVLADIAAGQREFTLADRLYDRASDTVEGIMVNVPSRTAQARLVGVMADLYAGHFRLAAAQLRDPEKAFRVAERARGRAVADVLRTLPTTPAKVEDDARLRRVSVQQLRLMKARSVLERRRLLDELWEAEQRTTVPMTKLPAVSSAGRGREVALPRLQRALGPDEVLLEYVLLEPDSYCFVITRQSRRLVRLRGRDEIERLAAAFSADVREGKPSVPDSGAALHAAVLEPLGVEAATARRTVIVPDGKLHLVPFDFLRAGASPALAPIAVVPSGSVLALLRQDANRRPADPLLAVGGVPYERMAASKGSALPGTALEPGGFFDAALPAKLPTLPLALAEVRSVATAIGPRSVVLAGEEATEAALKGAPLSRFEVIHLALHGFADPKNPERAASVLLSDPARGEDGLLQPREIARLRLNARLVVLSVCDTAVGPTIGQEGVLNLARAFILAGAGAVMTTLWTVNDAASAALMKRFYGRLATGEDMATALANAKRLVAEAFGPKMLPSLAAFQLVGDGTQRLTLVSKSGPTQTASLP
jgi:CHAT domain-containing protein/tetratricopeptide (TPR) repeat protein